ncbi:MAG: hypothetical protein RMJ05_06980 [Thermomicrobium sp.]|nr:hypothetical protein [Thermomicrobium sp.]MDW8060009.1 hypothetical protein [Thermomicrobium sp.]
MRARNLKPGFFKNESLAELPPLTRLLFQGLWCLADRRGRLEDRPKRIKAEVLPYDDWDVDAALDALAERGFIVRYEIEGRRYIQVVNFERHQTPHVREPESSIPPPPDTTCHGQPSTVPAPCEHSAAPVPDTGTHESGPSDSGLLTPDSGFLTTDTHNTRARARAVCVVEDRTIEFDDVVAAWNRICAGEGPGPPLPEVLGVTKQRRQRFALRCRELSRALASGEQVYELAWWEQLFERVRASPFLRGEGESGWQATLDWLLERSENIVRVIEGAFEPREKPGGGRPRPSRNGTVTAERLAELAQQYATSTDLPPSELLRREREAIRARKAQSHA